MRFKRAKVNDYRIRKKFAWLPITLFHNDDRVTQWLEFVYIEEVYDWNYRDIGMLNFTYCYWNKRRFVDKEDYEKYLSKKSS